MNSVIGLFKNNLFLPLIYYFRERPAAIPVEVKSIDDTSNFDEFPDVDLKIRKLYAHLSTLHNITLMLSFFYFTASAPQDTETSPKDWVFINYTYKRFEGLTQRGVKTPRKS